MHLRAVPRRARTKTRQRCTTAIATTPRLHQRSVTGAVLKPRREEAVVQRADVRSVQAKLCASHYALGGVLGAANARRERTGAMHRCVIVQRGSISSECTTTHLETAVGEPTLDMQAERAHGKRLQEVDAT